MSYDHCEQVRAPHLHPHTQQSVWHRCASVRICDMQAASCTNADANADTSSQSPMAHLVSFGMPSCILTLQFTTSLHTKRATNTHIAQSRASVIRKHGHAAHRSKCMELAESSGQLRATLTAIHHAIVVSNAYSNAIVACACVFHLSRVNVA